MRFDIITIFPKIFDSYLNESIIGRAKKKKLVEIRTYNLRDFTSDKYKKVDDKPYGGGAGMIFKVEPIFNCVNKIIERKAQNAKRHNSEGITRSKATGLKTTAKSLKLKRRIILFSAKGKTMAQQDVRRWAKYNQIIMICGRYEGVDERVAEHIADEEVSVGNYVLTGGEIPAMIIVDSVSRLISGVLGKKESLQEESFSMANSQRQIADSRKAISHKPLAISYLEHPQYTRPEKFKGWRAPKILLSGNHEKIKKWREKLKKNF